MTSTLINKCRGVTISLQMGGQECPTPICTPIPPKHMQKVFKNAHFPTLTHANGQMDQQTNGWTDGQTKPLLEFCVCSPHLKRLILRLGRSINAKTTRKSSVINALFSHFQLERNGWTEGWMDKASYRVAYPQLKSINGWT